MDHPQYFHRLVYVLDRGPDEGLFNGAALILAIPGGGVPAGWRDYLIARYLATGYLQPMPQSPPRRFGKADGAG